MTDFNKAFVLLSVHEKAVGHPKLRWLAEAAMAEIIAMQPQQPKLEEPKQEVVEFNVGPVEGVRRKL